MRTQMTFRYFKLFAVLGAGGILACCLMMYLLLDLTFSPRGKAQKLAIEDNQWVHIESRLAKLEEDLSRHHKAINAIKEASDVQEPPEEVQNHHVHHLEPLNPVKAPEKPLQCSFDPQKIPEVDIQMLELYKQLEFDNPDGGVWKQGWALKYDEKQWHKTRKLNVFVVPHSHNDPGWLETFEKYYSQKTNRILNNMVTKLSEDKRRKFIWAEMSFFKLWWDEQPKVTQEQVKRLIVDGQLEIVAGGWVMPDEAVSHWMAQLTQLTQGHQWLKANLDYIPTTGWAIDPFGLSPTMPYLLKNAGLENLIIQRVHYSVKKRLAKDKSLEFKWRQLWDNDGSSEILTHMMPFYSYDVPHTCGPDPKVCCQFDFFRLPNFGLSCPWRVPPKVVTKKNVAERAALLLDQYRKKSQLFRSNVVIAPLGDDFRYSQTSEWDAQFGNYQKIFDYLNSNEQLNVKIQFGTLTDYFTALREEQNVDTFPRLSGDFFTYADRDDHYWSGYYTSRPFHKRLDRVLLGSLRAAEVLSSIGWARGHEHLSESGLERRLSEARQWHSLFQHHDGVTGTARDDVVVDYAQKMISALNNSAHVLQQAAAHLLRSPQGPALDPEFQYFTLDEMRTYHTSVGDRITVSLGDDGISRRVVIFNPLPRQRTRVQTVIISNPYVRVTDRMGQAVECQLSPVWVAPGAISGARYELSFLVTVAGLGINTYLIHPLKDTSLPPGVHLANVTLYNNAVPPTPVRGFEHLQVHPSTQEFSIGVRPGLSAAFAQTGLLKALKIGETTFPVHLEFVKYGTASPGRPRSGAYLFLPDKPEPDPVYMTMDRTIHLVTGPILSRVFVDLPHLRHTCTLFNSPGSDGLGLHVLNEVDISETQNFELAMRLDTDISSGDEFFTDLNGLNMIRRQRFPKLPTQANYYPLPAAGYIEDRRVRLSVLTGQPLGAASMASGQFEIMQDRRLMQDDQRGLEQGVTDNLLTHHVFMILMEKRAECLKPPVAGHPAGTLSLGAHLVAEELLHPMITIHPNPVFNMDFNGYFSPLRFDLPVDVNIISMRTISVPDGAGKGVGMVIHRQAVDLCWGDKDFHQRFGVQGDGTIDIGRLLSFVEDWTISEIPLTFHSVGPTLKTTRISLCSHQISSLLFHKTQS
ncbi:alpha-mannosidase 2 [Diachasmimorpha longicaudata]|uniref:alpha-mannosidase 2 n=1 Tax=Diachasmimorpha longicaudata TaxID=58733 RepID=UPI0030B8DB5E